MSATPIANAKAPSPATTAARAAKLPWWGLLALSAAAFSAVLTEQLPAGLLPAMSRSLHVSQGRVGFLVTSYAAASFLAAIPVTAALRGLPRRPVLAGALAGFALGNAVTAISSSYPLTFAARLLAGAMGGTLWAMLAGYAARMVPAQRRGRAMAVVLAGITVALSLGIPAGTAFAAAVGWRAAFGTLAALAVVLVAWVRWQVPGFPGEPAAGPGPGQPGPVRLRHRHGRRDLDRRHRHRPPPAAGPADRPDPGRGRDARPWPARAQPRGPAGRRRLLGCRPRRRAHAPADRPGQGLRPRQRGCGHVHAGHRLQHRHRGRLCGRRHHPAERGRRRAALGRPAAGDRRAGRRGAGHRRGGSWQNHHMHRVAEIGR